jgi:broad specificity phosphatase PhoE
MTDFPELFVLRHGQTEWNAIGRHQGRLDSSLTDLGRQQAARQGQILKALELGAIDAWCSPQGRAMATAQIALEPAALTARTDARLCEVHFGDWQGLCADQISARWPDLAPEHHAPFDWHFLSPGGETFDDLRVRATGFLQDLTGPTVIVTHGVLSKVLRGVWLGLDRNATQAISGGQGVVFHLKDGRQTCLE